MCWVVFRVVSFIFFNTLIPLKVFPFRLPVSCFFILTQIPIKLYNKQTANISASPENRNRISFSLQLKEFTFYILKLGHKEAFLSIQIQKKKEEEISFYESSLRNIFATALSFNCLAHLPFFLFTFRF